MPHILAALFPDHPTAQRALQALLETGVARDRIAIIGEEPRREVSSISGFRELSARDDVAAELHGLALPGEDLRLFRQGLRDGHVLIAARVERADMEEAMRVIEMNQRPDPALAAKMAPGTGGTVSRHVRSRSAPAAGGLPARARSRDRRDRGS